MEFQLVLVTSTSIQHNMYDVLTTCYWLVPRVYLATHTSYPPISRVDLCYVLATISYSIIVVYMYALSRTSVAYTYNEQQ